MSCAPVEPGAEMRRIQPWRPGNGAEGSIFRDWNCDRCTVDHGDGWHTAPDFEGLKSCPILLESLRDGAKEWWIDVTGKYTVQAYGCDGFKGPCVCGS